MLSALDHRLRVRLALSLAQSALEAMRAGGAGPLASSSSSAAQQQPINPTSAPWAAPGGRAATRGERGAGGVGVLGVPFSVDADEDSDGLDAIMARLAAARPPPEVAKAAAKEFKRLRQSGASCARHHGAVVCWRRFRAERRQRRWQDGRWCFVPVCMG